ncbi:glutaredoxin family protein [Actinomycetospora flava]|uniref:glutaredoxin family protein n=1 Tax=Actinomycetospora flava TaxID=3129232 RepID=UPI0035A0BBA5
MADERSDERATTSVGGATGGRPGGSTATPVSGSDDGRVRVVVLVRADCRTCDRMEGVVREICGRAGEEHTVVDVDAPGTDPEWRAEYGDRIPVTLVDGVEVGSWRLEPDDLVRALAGEAP